MAEENEMKTQKQKRGPWIWILAGMAQIMELLSPVLGFNFLCHMGTCDPESTTDGNMEKNSCFFVPFSRVNIVIF